MSDSIISAYGPPDNPPQSSADIVNLAMLQLYQQPIVSLTDNSPQAAAASRVYDMRRRAVLRNFIWNFARMRGTCSLIPGLTPPFDYRAVYQFPNDLLRLHLVEHHK